MIVTARFVPVGRVVVNVLAGTSGLSRRKFLALSSVSALAWATYSIVIGVAAGAWLQDNPIVGAAVAVAVALALGIVIDRIGTFRSRRRPKPDSSESVRSAPAILQHDGRMSS
jgi:membrane-associated protein